MNYVRFINKIEFNFIQKDSLSKSATATVEINYEEQRPLNIHAYHDKILIVEEGTCATATFQRETHTVFDAIEAFYNEDTVTYVEDDHRFGGDRITYREGRKPK